MKHVDAFITNVESIAVRDVAGEGSQAELLIRTKNGTWSLRVIARRGRVIRITDMRARDRKRRRGRHLVDVAMEDVKP